MGGGRPSPCVYGAGNLRTQAQSRVHIFAHARLPFMQCVLSRKAHDPVDSDSGEESERGWPPCTTAGVCSRSSGAEGRPAAAGRGAVFYHRHGRKQGTAKLARPGPALIRPHTCASAQARAKWRECVI